MKKLIVFTLWLFSSSIFAQIHDSFSYRLTDHLALSGIKCKGGELSEVSDRQCEPGQWLVTLDDVNWCNEAGCSNRRVPAFIAKLKRVEIVTPSTISFYEVIPKDVLSSGRRRILGRYWIKFDLNENTEVVRICSKAFLDEIGLVF